MPWARPARSRQNDTPETARAARDPAAAAWWHPSPSARAHTSSTQKAAPGAIRTTLLPGGVSASPAAATASASATTPSSAAASRTRAHRHTPSATTALSSSAASQPSAPHAGSTSTERARIAGHDAVGLDEHERQQQERRRAGGAEQHAQRVEPQAARASRPAAAARHGAEEALRPQVIGGDRLVGLPVDLHARIELLQRLASRSSP